MHNLIFKKHSGYAIVFANKYVLIRAAKRKNLFVTVYLIYAMLSTPSYVVFVSIIIIMTKLCQRLNFILFKIKLGVRHTNIWDVGWTQLQVQILMVLWRPQIPWPWILVLNLAIRLVSHTLECKVPRAVIVGISMVDMVCLIVSIFSFEHYIWRTLIQIFETNISRFQMRWDLLSISVMFLCSL